MYGLIGKMKVQPGRRDELITLMTSDMTSMDGCLSYVIAADAGDPDGVWITEVWDSPEAHKASLANPAVGELIAKARPLIAGFEHRFETRPAGGIGL